MGRAAALRRDWRAASLAGPWTGAGEWWTAAVVPVSEALTTRYADQGAACTSLGRERAAAGIYLDEARADILLATTLAALRPARATAAVDALTVGWIDRTMDTIGRPCADPLTALAPVSYLAMRLDEVHAEAALTGTDAASDYTLVVVKAESTPYPLEREAHMMAAGVALRSAFRGGETLARLGPSCAVALAGRGAARLRDSLAVLAGEISLAMGDGLLPPTRTWLEPLPRGPQALGALLVELS